MTTFETDKAIYLQIADRLSDEILAGVYAEGARIPSVREYATLLKVNNHTAVNAYNQLESAGIIFNKRGLGFFVSEGAVELIKSERRQKFHEKTLKELYKQMEQLDIGIDEVVKDYKSTHP